MSDGPADPFGPVDTGLLIPQEVMHALSDELMDAGYDDMIAVIAIRGAEGRGLVMSVASQIDEPDLMDILAHIVEAQPVLNVVIPRDDPADHYHKTPADLDACEVCNPKGDGS